MGPFITDAAGSKRAPCACAALIRIQCTGAIAAASRPRALRSLLLGASALDQSAQRVHGIRLACGAAAAATPRNTRPLLVSRVCVRRASESHLGQQPCQLSSTVLPDLVIVYGTLASPASVDCPAHASDDDDRLARRVSMRLWPYVRPPGRASYFASSMSVRWPV